jgi:hypothetical protein
MGFGGVGLVAGGTLGAGLAPLVQPAAAQTSPIDELALALQFDPERIFRFVSDSIRYQPYAGLLRGAEGARLARAGNAVDQAALLAALLRASGITVRFVEGELDATQARRLLAASAIDEETLGQRTIEAIVEALPDGSLPRELPHDAETEARVATALASTDQVVSWARAQVLDTVDILESALASAGIALPTGPEELPDLERRRHVWLQMASGPVWIDLDPTVPGAFAGAVLATPAATMDVLPDELRHRLDFRVIGETVVGEGLVIETLQDVFEYADSLVGMPIGFINIERDGLMALGVDITSALSGGTTYLPCLIVREDVVVGPGAIRFGGSGGALDEVFGALSGGSAASLEGEPTAQWLEIEITSPGSQPIVVRREIFDRIGPAARVDGSGLAGLTAAELVELEPGQPPDFLPARTSHWLSVESAIVPVSRIERLAADPEDSGHLAALVHAYHMTQAAGGAALAGELGAAWFPNAPNVVSFTVTQELLDGQLAIRPLIDIWHRSHGRAPLDGVATPGSPLAGGVLAHTAERLLVGDADPAADPAARGPSVGAVFEAARAGGVGIRTLTEAAGLAELPFPPDTTARLAAALEAGHIVVVPEGLVNIGGAERTGWWRIDPVSGWAADEMDDGRGTAMLERALKELWNEVKAMPALRILGQCVLSIGFFAVSVWTAIGGVATAAYAGSAGSGIGAALGAVGAAAGVGNAGYALPNVLACLA